MLNQDRIQVDMIINQVLSLVPKSIRNIANMSGEQFTHTVKVQVKRSVDSVFTEFTGCGKYLKDD